MNDIDARRSMGLVEALRSQTLRMGPEIRSQSISLPSSFFFGHGAKANLLLCSSSSLFLSHLKTYHKETIVVEVDLLKQY